MAASVSNPTRKGRTGQALRGARSSSLQTTLLGSLKSQHHSKPSWPTDERWSEWAEAYLRALWLALPRLMKHLLTGRVEGRHDRHALASLSTVLCAQRSDDDWKALSADHRQRSVAADPYAGPLGGILSPRGLTALGARRMWFQLSRFSRAGPFPTVEKKEAALVQHCVDLQRSYVIPRRVRKSLTRFAERLSHGRGGQATTSYGVSASVETTRGEGGWRERVRLASDSFRARLVSFQEVCELAEYLDPWLSRVSKVVTTQTLETFRLVSGIRKIGLNRLRLRVDEVMFLYEMRSGETSGFTPQTWEFQREALFALSACVLAFRESQVKDTLPQIRRVVVEERGGKARVVTPLPWYLSFLGTYLNSWMLKKLKGDPRVDPFLFDYPDFSVAAERELIRSCDLSRASDLVPYQVARAIGHGFCRAERLEGSSVEKVIDVLTGPMVVSGEAKPWTTNGSPLMGSGPTWPILSVYNLWLTWESGGAGRCRVKGDDNLFVASLQVNENYNRKLSSTGGEISKGKDTLSAHGGCLVEHLCVVKAGRLFWIDTISVGSLAGRSRVAGRGAQTPSWTSGPSVDRSYPARSLCRIVRMHDFAVLRSHGLDPFIPREFGGPGFPGSQQEVRNALATLRPHWARALRVCLSQGQAGALLLATLVRPWNDKAGGALPPAVFDWVKDEVLAWNAEFRGSGVSQVSEPITVESLERDLLAPLASMAGLALGFTVDRTWGITVDGVRKALDEAIEKLNSIVPYPRLSDRPRNLTKGLLRYLVGLRQGNLVVPGVFRTNPSVGAASLGL